MKAIIFDKDGTLMVFDPFWAAVAEAALTDLSCRLGVRPFLEELKRSVGLRGKTTEKNSIIQKGTYKQAADAINAVLKETGSPARVSGQEIETIFLESTDHGEICPACDGLPQRMKKLRDRGIMLFLVTTDIPAITYQCLDGLGITSFFQEVITDNGAFPAKPDPSAINYLLEKYRLEPEDICMVGDTETDMLFAKNGGIMGILVGGEPLKDSDVIRIPDVSYLDTVIE